MLGANVRDIEGEAGIEPLTPPWLLSECCDTVLRMTLRLLLSASSRADLSVSLLFTEKKKKHTFLPCLHHGRTVGIVIVIHRKVGMFEHEMFPIRPVEKAQLKQHL